MDGTYHYRAVQLQPLDVPTNHSSISPDGRTLLSVGDSSNVYFHHISGGARLTFSPIKTLTIPAPDTSPYILIARSIVLHRLR